MAEDSGLLLNIDEGKARILGGSICDRISSPCTTLTIKFTCEDLLVFENFNGDFYFRYCGMDWVPIRNNFNSTNEGVWCYDLVAVPKTLFSFVKKPIQNASALARIIKSELTDDSENLKFKYHIINQNVYALMKFIRLNSFNNAYTDKDMGKAFFVYTNGQSTYCSSWSSMCEKEARSLEFTELEQQNVRIKILDSRPYNYLNTPQWPKAWSENDYLVRMVGVMYEILMPKGAEFCRTYTMKFNDKSECDAPNSLLCTKTEVDLLDSSKFTCTFSQINLFKG